MNTNDPIGEYENIKSKLIENLKQVDGSPWVLIDYRNGTETVGIYTYGNLCPACEVVRRYESGDAKCEKSHLEIVNRAKGDKKVDIERCWTEAVCYVTCPVKVGEIKRVFLIGQRLGLEQNSESLKSLANRAAYELKLDMSESEDEAYKRDLEDAFGKVKVLSKETECKVKELVNKCKEDIEGKERKVDFSELESYAGLDNRSIRLKKDIAMIRDTIPDQKIKEIQDLADTFVQEQVKFNSPLLQERIKRDLLYWETFLQVYEEVEAFDKP